MAIKIYKQFAPFANPADGDYPQGSFKNDSIPGAEDGTPLDAVWANDYAGFDAALFAQAGIVPSGNPDTVVESQRVDAMSKLFNRDFSSLSEFASYPNPLEGAVYAVGFSRWKVVSYQTRFPVSNGLYAYPTGSIYADVRGSVTLQTLIDIAFDHGVPVDLQFKEIEVSGLNLWTGVKIRNGKLKRNSWLPSGSSSVITSYGENQIETIKFDGNFANIPVGAVTDATQYAEIAMPASGNYIVGPDGQTIRPLVFAVAQEVSVVTKCTFDDAPGSHISGSGAVGALISNNLFKKYRDHAVYFSGHGFNDFVGVAGDAASSQIIVDSNIVQNSIYAEAGNGAFKVRNQVRNAVFSHNAISVTGSAFVVDIADNHNVDGYRNISISNNMAACGTFLQMFHQSWGESPADRGTVIVTGNIASCESNPLKLGTQGQPISGRLLFSGNQLYAQNNDVITFLPSADPGGLSSFTFAGNEFFNITFQMPYESSWGSLTIKDNKFTANSDRYLLRFTTGTKPVNLSSCKTTIVNNTLKGYFSIMLADTASGEYGLMSRGDAYVANNSVRLVGGTQGHFNLSANYGNEAAPQGSTLLSNNDCIAGKRLFPNVKYSHDESSVTVTPSFSGVTATFVPTSSSARVSNNDNIVTVNFSVQGQFSSLGGAGGANEFKLTGIPSLSPEYTPVVTLRTSGITGVTGQLHAYYDGNVRFSIMSSTGSVSVLSGLNFTVGVPFRIDGTFCYYRAI